MMGRRHHPRSGSELGKVEAETRRHPVPWRKKGMWELRGEIHGGGIETNDLRNQTADTHKN